MKKKRQRTELATQSAYRSLPLRQGDASEDEVLAVLLDKRSGQEYYVSIIDNFQHKGRDYAVMYNYEPDDGTHANPEIVIMRAYRDEMGTQFFASIKNRKELDGFAGGL